MTLPNNQETAPLAWGTGTRISATVKELNDLEGNRDGLWDNERAVAGRVASVIARNSLALTLRAFAAASLHGRDDRERLKSFLARAEEEWEQSTVTSSARAHLRDADLFAVQKAIALKRLGRTPETVVDQFLSAAGSVNGAVIAPRRIFTQHFRPTAEPTRTVVVVAPGYGETGRNFYQQIVRLNAVGHDVLVMDQQWAGQSDGSPGRVDRGFGIMRDVAAVAAHGARLGEGLYGREAGSVLYGNSMGAFGVLGAYLLNRADLVSLAGTEMPKEMSVVVQSAFLGATRTLRNRGLQALARTPLLRQACLPLIEGLPRLTNDPHVKQLLAQGVALEDIRCQAATFATVQADIAFLKEFVKRAPPPPGAITMVHTEGDPLASFTDVRWFVEAAGKRGVELLTLQTRDHVLEQSPSQMHYAVDAVNAAIARA